MLVNEDFLTWLLIGWRLCCQPIRCQVWKSLLINMDFSMEIVIQASGWLALLCLYESCELGYYTSHICKWLHDDRLMPLNYWPYTRGIHQSSADSPHKGPVMQSCDISFAVCLNKLLNKQSICHILRQPAAHVTSLLWSYNTDLTLHSEALKHTTGTIYLTHWPAFPDSKVHGANMGPTWGRQDPGGSHVGPMNIAIRNGMSSLGVLGILGENWRSYIYNATLKYSRIDDN